MSAAPTPATRAALKVFAVAAVAAAAGGLFYWRAHPRDTAAPASAAPAPARMSSAAAPASSNAEASGSDREESRSRIAQDVAARVQASYDAAKAKADAEKHAPDSDTLPELPLEDLITRSLPAVVRVETSEGLGTGFFIAAD